MWRPANAAAPSVLCISFFTGPRKRFCVTTIAQTTSYPYNEHCLRKEFSMQFKPSIKLMDVQDVAGGWAWIKESRKREPVLATRLAKRCKDAGQQGRFSDCSLSFWFLFVCICCCNFSSISYYYSEFPSTLSLERSCKERTETQGECPGEWRNFLKLCGVQFSLFPGWIECTFKWLILILRILHSIPVGGWEGEESCSVSKVIKSIYIFHCAQWRKEELQELSILMELHLKGS